MSDTNTYRHPSGKTAVCSEQEWARHGYRERGYVLVDDSPKSPPPKPKKGPKLKPGYDPDEIG